MRKASLFWSIGAAYLLVWALVSWLSSPSLDAYGDMVENFAWSQTWAWGSFKHPPLFAWMVRLWFDVFPTRVWAYYLLSYLNAGIGIVGILWLARLWIPPAMMPQRRDVFIVLVLLFAVLSAPYSNLAAKFNADTVQLSLWPWTALAFFGALHSDNTLRRWAFTLLLGVTGACAMLGKYYSGVLLASLFIISMASSRGRRWYTTPYPYAALAVFALLLVPHALWEMHVGFPSRQYIETRIDAGVSAWRIMVFLLSAIYYLPLSWIAWLILRARVATEDAATVGWAIPLRSLILLCVIPVSITIAFAVFGRVHLTTHWAIPIWFALPILMAALLLPRIPDEFPWRPFVLGVVAFLAAVLIGGVAYTIVLSARGDARYALGRQDMVRAIDARFAERFPSQRLSWAGGSWPESGAVAFFAPDHPRALPGLPDDPRALVNPYAEWRETYGVLLCFAGDDYAREGAHNTECESRTRAWLESRQRPRLEETLRYRAEGAQFARAAAKNVTVFWVPPR